MKHMLVRGTFAGAMAMAVAGGAAAAPCLQAGDPTNVLGATVQTFINLGIDPTVTCIENSLWTDPSGFQLGSYVKGAEGMGGSPDPTQFAYDGSTVNGTFAGNANARDFFWVQDTGNGTNFGTDLNGAITGGTPSQGIVWNLGGQANQAVVFVQVDHGPLPGEVLENTAWLSNDPNAADGGWLQAVLDHVYLQGWSPNPNVVDGFVAVYKLPNNQTFQYVSVTHGGPGAVHRDGDNEIDAVGGLSVRGCGVNDPNCVGRLPEPGSLALLAIAGLAFGFVRRSDRRPG